MSDKLRCEIVQDLLPSYVDGLTSDETNEAIKDHLADCVSCRDMYERMKADETSAEENSEVMEKEKKEMQIPTEIQLQSLLSFSKDTPLYLAILLAFSMGLRRGEICGLKWRDIDFSKNKIQIENEIKRDNNRKREKTGDYEIEIKKDGKTR